MMTADTSLDVDADSRRLLIVEEPVFRAYERPSDLSTQNVKSTFDGVRASEASKSASIRARLRGDGAADARAEIDARMNENAAAERRIGLGRFGSMQPPEASIQRSLNLTMPVGGRTIRPGRRTRSTITERRRYMAGNTAIDQLDWILKLILTIFCDPIVMGINRILRGRFVIGILWIITGGLFGIGWVIDIVTMFMSKDITVLA
jgi:hypothetical protein